MAEFQLDIQRMIANDNYKVLIAGLGGPALQGFLQEDMQFSGGNNYNNAFESEAQQRLTDVANRALPALSGVVNAFGGDVPSAQFALKSFEQTTESWTGSAKPSFPMKLTFVALKPDDDVRVHVQKIMAAVMPVEGKLSSIGSVIQAPLKYGPQLTAKNKKLALSVEGTLTVAVGKWFRAMGQIIRSANTTYSRQVIASGLPLYATVSLTFEPYRMISYDEFKGYFV
jgi:hypothetical protein